MKFSPDPSGLVTKHGAAWAAQVFSWTYVQVADTIYIHMYIYIQIYIHIHIYVSISICN